MEKKCIKCNEIMLFSGFRKQCRECESKKSKEYQANNKYHLANKSKEWREKNKEKLNQKKRELWQNLTAKQRELIAKKSKEYHELNREKRNAYYNDYCKNKIKTDKLFKLKTAIRGCVGQSIRLKNYTKKSRTYEILGCSYEDFKIHIESQFNEFMTWDNHGNPKDGIVELNKTWDLDHIIPISSAKTEEEIYKLNHYTNFQPLCSYVNRFIKRDKI